MSEETSNSGSSGEISQTSIFSNTGTPNSDRLPEEPSGSKVSYALSGIAVSADGAELAALFGSLVWIAVSFIVCKKPKRG